MGPRRRRRFVGVYFSLYCHTVPGSDTADSCRNRERGAPGPDADADADRSTRLSARLPAAQQALHGPGGWTGLCYACSGGVHSRAVRGRDAGNRVDHHRGNVTCLRASDECLLLPAMSGLRRKSSQRIGLDGFTGFVSPRHIGWIRNGVMASPRDPGSGKSLQDAINRRPRQ